MTGTYTQITEIIAPNQATLGDTVVVTAKAKNISSSQIHMYIIGVVTASDGSYVRFIDWVSAWVNPGAVFEASGQFTPGGTPGSLTINIQTWYEGTDGSPYSDDTMSKILEVVGTQPPTQQGIITKKELEYDSARATIPATNIAKDKNALVHIWGKNTTLAVQQMGIEWAVKDPSGIIRESYSTWELWPYTGAGSEHEFIGGRFPLSVAGTWMIDVSLKMNPSNPVVVDTYNGILCTVAVTAISTQLSGMTVNTSGGDYKIGDKVPFSIDFKYRGEAQEAVVEVAVGSGITFTPIMSAVVTLPPFYDNVVHLPLRNTLVQMTSVLGLFVVPTGVSVGSSYSIRLKMTTADGISDSDDMYGAFKVVNGEEIPSDYTLIKDYTYPYASTYNELVGAYADTLQVTFDIVAPSFLISSSKQDEIVAKFEEQITAENANVHVLSIKLYEKSGLLKSSYIAEMILTSPNATGPSVSGLGVSPQFAVLGIPLSILIYIISGIIVIVLGILLVNAVGKQINTFLFGKPPSDGEPGTTGMMDMIIALVMVMMMSMMMEMMGPMVAPAGTPPQPKPVTEAVVKGAKEVGKGIISGGKYVIQKIKERGEEEY